MDSNTIRKCAIVSFIAFITFTFKMEALNCLENSDRDGSINHDYPMHLLKNLPNAKERYNLLFSPLSLRLSLLAAAFVAHGDTRNQINKLSFGLGSRDLLQELKSLEKSQNIRLFVHKKYDVTPCVKKYLGNITEYIDYTNADASANTINNWVKNKSDNAVSQITLPKFHKGNFNFLTFVHMQYLDAKWLKPFQNILPRGDNSTGEVFNGDMLHQDNVFLYGKLNDLGLTAVELPLSNNTRMVILQPLNYTKNFESLKEALQKVDIRKISSRLKKTEISLYFPKLFAIKMDRSMIETMKLAYNIHTPFNPSSADFRKFHSCGDDTYIRLYNQRSRIYVNTTGVRIGSATGLQFSYPNIVPTMISGEDDEEEDEPELSVFSARIVLKPKKNLPKVVLVKPFLYAIIRDDEPLWLGSLVKPHNLDD